MRSLRILAGEDADESKYPYIGALDGVVKDKIVCRCTCTIISSKWTLTAGHCIANFNDHKARIKARAVVKYYNGNYDGNNNQRKIAQLGFSFVKVLLLHPNYKPFGDTSANDIGLVNTETIKLKEYAKVSAVDWTSILGQQVLLFGFGITHRSGVADTSKKPLQVVNAMAQKCDDKTLRTAYPLFCLAHRCGRISGVTLWDSGGPTIHSSGVIAITSFADSDLFMSENTLGSSTAKNAGMVTPISPYLDWIASIINKNEKKDC